MKIGGFLPFTTIDFPNHLSAVVFFSGCPWKCRYCHNTHLKEERYIWKDLLKKLNDRKKFLDAVVFSGGEPLLQEKLMNAIQDVKDLGFLAGLHTSGAYPDRLEKILPFLDWVGMDIKADFDDYEKITKVKDSGKKAFLSSKLILNSKKAYEFRTTIHSFLLSNIEIKKVAKTLSNMGAENYFLQEFQKNGCIDKELLNKETKIAENLYKEIKPLFKNFSIRKAD